MSKPLSSLAEGARINIIETIGGAKFTVPMLIIANNKNKSNPYGEDVALCIRNSPTGQSFGKALQDGTIRYYSSNSPVNYESSLLDAFIRNEWVNRLSAATKACIKPSTIKCYSQTSGEAYELERVAFALSYHEAGGGTAGSDMSLDSNLRDTSVDPGYFVGKYSRRAYSSTGDGQLPWLLRTPYDSTHVMDVDNNGQGGGLIQWAGPGNYYHARPACNFYSSTLVSDMPDANGAYSLLPDSAAPYKTLDFECLIGESEHRISQARVFVPYSCRDENIDIGIQLCNNFHDESPVWEDANIGENHIFQNQAKTSDAWALGIAISAKAENIIDVYEPSALILLDN